MFVEVWAGDKIRWNIGPSQKALCFEHLKWKYSINSCVKLLDPTSYQTLNGL